jgi:hypothetical protein
MALLLSNINRTRNAKAALERFRQHGGMLRTRQALESLRLARALRVERVLQPYLQSLAWVTRREIRWRPS